MRITNLLALCLPLLSATLAEAKATCLTYTVLRTTQLSPNKLQGVLRSNGQVVCDINHRINPVGAPDNWVQFYCDADWGVAAITNDGEKVQVIERNGEKSVWDGKYRFWRGVVNQTPGYKGFAVEWVNGRSGACTREGKNVG